MKHMDIIKAMTPQIDWTPGRWDTYQRAVGATTAWAEFTKLAFLELARLRAIEARMPTEQEARDKFEHVIADAVATELELVRLRAIEATAWANVRAQEGDSSTSAQRAHYALRTALEAKP